MKKIPRLDSQHCLLTAVCGEIFFGQEYLLPIDDTGGLIASQIAILNDETSAAVGHQSIQKT